MAINHSEYSVHVTDKKGKSVCVKPGDEIPDGVDVDNPYVLGDDAEGGSDGPPPKAGRGSGEDKWRAYAEANDVDVSAATNRDEVIAAVANAGVPIE
jgi:hypothetical protein